MRLGIHVLTYNRPMELGVMLSSLLAQSFKEWDLVLVDSSEQKVAGIPTLAKLFTFLKLEGHGFEYVPLDYRPSIGEARNIAIKNDDNEVCVRIDDDSYLDSRYLEKLVGTYSAMNSVNKVGAVGGVVPLFGSPDVVGRAYKFKEKPFNEIIFHKDGIEVADDGGVKYLPELVAVPSHHLRSSFLFNKKAVIEAGGHPKEYGYTGFREETDLCIRLVMHGYQLYTNLGAYAYHVKAQTGGARIQGYQEQVMLNEEMFTRKFLRLKEQGKIAKEMFTEGGDLK